MNTNFYNKNGNLLIAGETIEKVFIYGNGEIFAELENVQEHEIKETISSVYDGEARKIFLNSEDIKRCNKLNLNRKDDFYIKNPDKKYYCDRQYNLYIHVSSVIFKNLGEILASKTKDEKCYLQSYKITFPAVEFKRCKYEKEYCEKYTLKENETFSEHCYGSDKEHPCVSFFDENESLFFKKINKDKKPGKGIIRRYFEIEKKENCEMILTKRCYTKIEKSEKRKNNEMLADKFNEIIGKDVFYYFTIEKLLEKFEIKEK